MEKMIEVKNVSKYFGKNENKNQVLNGAAFSVERGEFVSLMEPPEVENRRFYT